MWQKLHSCTLCSQTISAQALLVSMGTSGMQYSLLSRELIADSFETICQAHHYDGLISIPGCDKNLPGVLISMVRLNRPSFIISASLGDNRFRLLYIFAPDQ